MQHSPEIITNSNDCSRLWEQHGLGKKGYGVTGSYSFREFYASVHGMRPHFVCDDANNPSYILPLSADEHGVVDYFGTSDLEDSVVAVTVKGAELFLRARESLNAPQAIKKVNHDTAQSLTELGLVGSQVQTGIKVVESKNQRLQGSGHFSPKNLQRAVKALNGLGACWQYHERPSFSEIQAVFEASIGQFEARNRTSKFTDETRRERYAQIYGLSIPGIIPMLATCTVKDIPAIRALFLLCNEVATVSTIAVNTQHPDEKVVSQYGFKYGIAAMGTELITSGMSAVVDYQGGDHFWKTEILPVNQIRQYETSFRS